MKTCHSSGLSCRKIGDIFISYPDVRMDDISMHPAYAIWLYPAAENFACPSLQIDESNATYSTPIQQ